MKKSTKVLLTGAAMAGLMAGVATRTYAGQTTEAKKGTTLSNFGQLDDSGDKGKHECKGKNECKGQGGCKTDSNACKGHNSCKGQGGCNTMPKDK
ncbi:MAG: hypothetical protein WCS70_06010 [Verrucomicrobiota bacterium]